MNRKQRRAARKETKRACACLAPLVNRHSNEFTAALAHCEAGRISEAERICRNILAADSRHSESLHLLGLIAHQNGHNGAALELIGKAITANPQVFTYHYNAGSILFTMGRTRDAITHYKQATICAPGSAEARMALGNVLVGTNRLDEAVQEYEHAIRIAPHSAEPFFLLGNALQLQSRLWEAVAQYERALNLKPDFPELHNNLGNALRRIGKLQEAIARCRRSLVLRPDNPEAHNNLGLALQQQGLLAEAVECYKSALALRPSFLAALKNLCIGLLIQGSTVPALLHSLRAIEIEESIEMKGLFVKCVRALGDHIIPKEPIVRQLVIRALSEPWGRPNDLVYIGARLLTSEPLINHCLERAQSGRALSIDLLQSPSLCRNELLRCLLVSAPITDFRLERFLTAARRTILEFVAAVTTTSFIDASLLEFACALAEQCFINEYVYWYDDEEFQKACKLRDRVVVGLKFGRSVSELTIAAAAAYFPLHSFTVQPSPNGPWSNAIVRLISQQLLEPERESTYRATLPHLIPISDEISRSVQRQYEENPYPRWVKTAVMARPSIVSEFLRELFPQACLSRFDKPQATEILIAGCGTGQHPIETAMRFSNVRILAVDLSSASLCYARRKTDEIGLTNIRYAQADILEMQSSGLTFDMIEAMGVLHHLRNPLAGWQAMLSVLRPGGFMRVGLYSAVARQKLTEAQDLIHSKGHQPTISCIRRFRQELAASGLMCFDQLAIMTDFYSISGCRDALFNVQEHRMTIPRVKHFIDDNGIKFMGFALDPRILLHFQQRFTWSDAANDLDLWEIFENENPETFLRMYQFWIQKPL